MGAPYIYNISRLRVVRRDLVPTIVLYCIVLYYNFSYLWFYVKPDDGYIQPKHVADLYRDKLVVRLCFCIFSFLLIYVLEESGANKGLHYNGSSETGRNVVYWVYLRGDRWRVFVSTVLNTIQ